MAVSGYRPKEPNNPFGTASVVAAVMQPALDIRRSGQGAAPWRLGSILILLLGRQAAVLELFIDGFQCQRC